MYIYLGFYLMYMYENTISQQILLTGEFWEWPWGGFSDIWHQPGSFSLLQKHWASLQQQICQSILAQK